MFFHNFIMNQLWACSFNLHVKLLKLKRYALYSPCGSDKL